MPNRYQGGSSPHKEALYKGHAPITARNKRRNVEKKVRSLNKRAEQLDSKYRYKVEEKSVTLKSGVKKVLLQIGRYVTTK